jgi:hypothetical protein
MKVVKQRRYRLKLLRQYLYPRVRVELYSYCTYSGDWIAEHVWLPCTIRKKGKRC